MTEENHEDKLDLTVFYKDFDDPEFKDDLARLPKEIDAFTAAIAAPAEDEVKKLVSLVHQEERCPTFSSV